MNKTNWQQLLRSNIRDWKLLTEYLQLDEQQSTSINVDASFPLNIPMRLAQKIPKGTLNDPILKQFLPMNEEKTLQPGFSLDPVADASFRCQSKLLHKYEGRVLIVCTSVCAMHCRYCFRQNFDYPFQDKIFDTEIKHILADTTIEEVILSGGDPLSLSDRILEELLTQIAAIPHVKRIRFHTRFPIAFPERITNGFVNLLSSLPQQIYFVIHANHPRELDTDVLAALTVLKKQGITLLNQAVLLRDVNDNIDVLFQLCSLLVNHGIIPYYLHQLDKVQGAAHFEVPESVGLQLIEQLTALLPGFAIPKYVREMPDMPSKTPIK